MDHHFIVDKSLYDIAATDLKEIWDADIDPHDFKIEDDWSPGSGMAGLSRSQVIIHDRLMSDAVLGGDSSPIKSEHSYCSQLSNSPTPPPINGLKDETEDDCLLPAVPTKPARLEPSSVPFVVIKAEPMSEPSSPDSSCPSSPSPPPRSLKGLVSSSDTRINSDKFKESRFPTKQNATALTNKHVGIKRKHQMISTNVIKIEPSSTSSTRFPLPPTPPSCASSDNEGNVSPLHQSPPTRTLFLSAPPTTTTRQPIQTPLISSQPKGSTGMLLLTEEEKRTLIAEGYPIPVRLPLTKAEEKCLKKIRRKIKNKISAQESRRKKKEYMDALERKVEILSSENADFIKKINTLEDMNTNLTSQVSRLQNIIARLGGVNTRGVFK